MYAKLCAVIAVLVLGATAFGANSYAVINQTFTTNFALGQNWTYAFDPETEKNVWVTQPMASVFYFDVICFLDAPSVLSTGVGIGSSLSGPGIGHLIADPTYMQYTRVSSAPSDANGVTDFVVRSGAGVNGWAWLPVVVPPFNDFGTTASNSKAGVDDPPGAAGVPHPADALLTFGLVDNKAVGATVLSGKTIARFVYAWDGVAMDMPTIHIQGDSATELNPYLLTSGGPKITLVPEPATMGLLGLGLVGLIARRRNKK